MELRLLYNNVINLGFTLRLWNLDDDKVDKLSLIEKVTSVTKERKGQLYLTTYD